MNVTLEPERLMSKLSTKERVVVGCVEGMSQNEGNKGVVGLKQTLGEGCEPSNGDHRSNSTVSLGSVSCLKEESGTIWNLLREICFTRPPCLLNICFCAFLISWLPDQSHSSLSTGFLICNPTKRWCFSDTSQQLPPPPPTALVLSLSRQFSDCTSSMILAEKFSTHIRPCRPQQPLF